ncbi:PDZ domain-containing protein [uncultured Gimesia sp.]|uniref:PDZ domain-containing protein n=1 Tax=uncultured Gimesia sp. TaxID=1678688 RepID=UPI00260D2624|nr:PDZ domain-containing protein [uncultured Gimesia sp.]
MNTRYRNNMTLFRFAITFLVLVGISDFAFCGTVTGADTGTKGARLRVALAKGEVAKVGDRVEIYLVVPNVGVEASVATGRVASVKGKTIEVDVVKASGTVIAGQKVRFLTKNPKAVKGTPEDGSVPKETNARIGMVTRTVNTGDVARLDLSERRGIVILAVWPDQPAEKAGVQVGDVILKLNGVPIANNLEFNNLRKNWRVGDRIQMDLIRAGEKKSATATLVKRPETSVIIENLKDLAEQDSAWAGLLGMEYYKSQGIVKRDMKQAVKWITKAAEGGNHESQSQMAWLYNRGEGVEVEVDHERGFQFAKSSAEGGYPAGQAELGRCYYFGWGTDKDSKLAVQWWQRAADQNDARAMFNLGRAFEQGYGVDKSLTQAFHWWKKSAESGYPMAQTQVGLCYQRSIGTKQDFALARSWYEKGAANGFPEAMNSLGVIHQYGLGVPRDYPEAIEWYEKAAAKNNTNALVNLSDLYERGHGVKQNSDQAIKYLLQAAEAKNTGAQIALGYRYSRGQGVEVNHLKAREWFQKAVNLGNIGALTNLGVQYLYGNGVEKDYEKAAEHFLKAANAEQSMGQFYMGLMCLHGWHYEQDYPVALNWFRNSAKQGNLNAEAQIGYMYENGWGLPKDRVEAIARYIKAAKGGNVFAQKQLDRLGVKK